MANSHKSIVRQGRMYRFSIEDTDYDAFIWQAKSKFSGRVMGQPQVPQCTARTAILVRDTLAAWMGTESTKKPAS